jgi:hypothetical protein
VTLNTTQPKVPPLEAKLPVLLTVAELAGALKLTHRTAWDRVEDGSIPYINIAPAGSKRQTIRVDAADVRRYLKACRTTGGS